jgi:hypothetical protein
MKSPEWDSLEIAALVSRVQSGLEEHVSGSQGRHGSPPPAVSASRIPAVGGVIPRTGQPAMGA